MGQQDTAKRELWRARIAEWKRSGKPAAEYGREHGVSKAAVYWWSKELQQHLPVARPSTTAMAFVRLPTRVSVPAAPSTTPMLEVVVRGERRVRVPAEFSASTLQQIVRALEAVD